MARNWLRSKSVTVALRIRTNTNYLHIHPLVGARRKNLKTTQTIMDNGLPNMGQMRKTDNTRNMGASYKRAKVCMRTNPQSGLAWRRLNTPSFATVDFFGVVPRQKFSGRKSKSGFEEA